MRLLHAGVDTTVIALWLGHEQVATTQVYIHADLTLKERALARTTPPPPPQAATSHQTRSSPSSKACDYADLPSAVTPNASGTAHHLGITTTSA
jgi:hypothetical protein